MRENAAKAKWRRGQAPYGAWLSIPSAAGGFSGRFACYAARGISHIMPTSGLCRSKLDDQRLAA